MSSDGYFVGDWSLHKADEPGDFLCVPDREYAFAFVRPNGQEIEIDREFITDGASVPRMLRLTKWLDPYGSIFRAALFHDWLWVLRYTGENTIGFRESNRIMWEACEVCGLKGWQRWLVWFGITVGGWPQWFQGTLRERKAEAAKCLSSAKEIAEFKGV